jgi:prepilin-type processing-associated H-X9-DG protein
MLLFAECVIGNSHGGRDAPVLSGMAYGMPFGADAVPMRCLERAGKNRWLTGEQNHDVLTGMRGAGLCWLSGRQVNDQFFTILPPNSPSCSSETDWQDWALNSASSYHPGGCHVAMADGSVMFVNNDINCGDLSQPALDVINKYRSVGLETAESTSYTKGESPWGVWGAMGHRFPGPTNDGIP